MAAEPLSASTLLAVTALSSLAQAGGMAGQGYFQGKMAEDQMKWDKKKTLRDWQERDEEQAFAREQYRDGQLARDRQEVLGRPAASLSMLSGLTALGQGMARTTPVDYLSFLGGVK